MKKTLSLLLVFSILLSGCMFLPTSDPAEVDVVEPTPAEETVDHAATEPDTVDEGLAAPQSAGTVPMTLTPATNTVNVGQTFNMTVQVAAGTQPVNTVQVSLKFDPAYLEVVTLNAGDLDSVVQNEHDNALGTISYAAGKLGGTITGSFSVVQITFKAKAAIANTAVTFQYVQPLVSDVINEGLSVMSSASNASVTIQDGGTVPTNTPVPGVATATPVVPSSGTTYTVQAGDNLYRIGLKFGVSWITIQTYNNLPSTLIYVGQVLQIPGTSSVVPTTNPTLIPGNTTHTVVAGQNLFRIGLMYGVQWPAIMAHNGLASTLIYPGQVLKIP